MANPRKSNEERIEEKKQQLLEKIKTICERMVRVRNSARTHAVTWYWFQVLVAVLVPALSGAGLMVVNQSEKPLVNAANPWVFVSGLITFLLSVQFGMYKAFGVEQTAIQLLAAKEAYRKLLRQLESAVTKEEPAEAIIRLYEESESHWTSLCLMLDMRRASKDDVAVLLNEIVSDYPTKWKITLHREQ
jgi:hypothetical protein